MTGIYSSVTFLSNLTKSIEPVFELSNSLNLSFIFIGNQYNVSLLHPTFLSNKKLTGNIDMHTHTHTKKYVWTVKLVGCPCILNSFTILTRQCYFLLHGQGWRLRGGSDSLEVTSTPALRDNSLLRQFWSQIYFI